MNWNSFNTKPEIGSSIQIAKVYSDDPMPILVDVFIEDQNTIDELIKEIKDYFDINKSMWKYNSRKVEKIDTYKMANVNFSVIGHDDERWEEYKQQRLDRGFDDSETWNLDTTIAKFILPRLKRFKETINGYPGGMTSDEWDAIIDKMILAFETYVDEQFMFTRSEEEKERLAKIDEGLDLFRKYFFNLWW